MVDACNISPGLTASHSHVDVLPAKSFTDALKKNQRTHDLAMRKLVIVSIVSVFFITA